ncbi:MAG: aldolase/citrate lyase family protein [Tissierellaceae bacterium]|nr:aldolase/citrate lyase family protein [Tissierellaceae bacterium]
MKNMTKEKLRSGKAVFGTFMTINSFELSQVFGNAGYDFIIIDYEHGAMDMETVGRQVAAIKGIGDTSPLVRVPINKAEYVKKGLDSGAYGLMYPMIRTKEDVEEAVKHFYYPPKGTRGIGATRANLFFTETEKYLKFTEKDLLCMIQIETKESVENLDEILSVKGIDVAFVGPYDLSYSLGVGGQIGHQKVEEAIEYIGEKCMEHNVIPGIMTNKDKMERHMDLGYRFIVEGVDGLIISNAIKNDIEYFKAINKKS